MKRAACEVAASTDRKEQVLKGGYHMKKYLSIACVFLLGNEALSWIAAAVIAWMVIVDFAKEVDREASRTRF